MTQPPSLIPSFSKLWPFYHLGRGELLFYQSIKLCSRTAVTQVCTFCKSQSGCLIFTADGGLKSFVMASILLSSFEK